ncbi:hypothetical protein KBI51_06915 [Aerococcaceae bacterium zg-ZUI334]|uniref:hypothetical protein n=1 Tax=Aerococcaceae bacterium zg-252 TaxID=2796928 RepID=UPI001B92DE78|nr:hypothetical protein [Aerococcaceae bacterium zg-ZUI334]
MKQKLINGLRQYPELRGADLNASISFLESATFEELKSLGHAVFYLTSPPLMKKLSSWYNNGVDCSFRDEYCKFYGIAPKITSQDKTRGNKLYEQLKNKPNLTPKEFLST